MLYNKVSYQSPPALFDRSLIQHVKYPRDVIRNKSGTCIDLAITFASAAEALGMEPFLILIPGHCFPGFFLPKSRTPVAVEMTLLGGGTAQHSKPFEVAFQTGNKELQDAAKDGRYIEIIIKDLRKKGMLNPELAKLPANILKEFGIKKPEGYVETGATPLPSQQQHKQQQHQHQQYQQQQNIYRHPNGLYVIPSPGGFSIQQPDITTTYFIDNNRNALVMAVAYPKTFQNQYYSLTQVLRLALETFQAAMEATSISVSDQPKAAPFCGQNGYLDVLQATFYTGNAAGFYIYTETEYYYYIFACAAMQEVFQNYKQIFVTMAEGMRIQ
jgi:hypothetical protein